MGFLDSDFEGAETAEHEPGIEWGKTSAEPLALTLFDFVADFGGAAECASHNIAVSAEVFGCTVNDDIDSHDVRLLEKWGWVAVIGYGLDIFCSGVGGD